MKVVFRGDKTADVSAIQSVSVSKASKRIEVSVKYKTGKTGKQKVSYLAYPCLRYSRHHLPELAKKFVKELEFLAKAPDIPIEQVVELTAWWNGHLQVKMNTDSHASVRGFALLCRDWPLGQKPSDEDLKFRTGFKAAEIKRIASTGVYKQSVEEVMLEAYDTPEFKWWLRDYGRNIIPKFGKRMRLSEDTATELIYFLAEQHDVDLGNLKSSSALFEPERTIGSGRQSVYLYYYQWDRESAESKGEKVWKCKIGKAAERRLQARLKEQATDPEKFKLGLHIQTDRPKEIEDTIHDVLTERGRHIDKSLRKEWFLTSPSEVEEIYEFIGESS